MSRLRRIDHNISAGALFAMRQLKAAALAADARCRSRRHFWQKRICVVGRGASRGRRAALSTQGVLDDLAVLHDERERLLRLRDQPDVLDGIAVDHQEIGERIHFDHAELAGIGIAWT